MATEKTIIDEYEDRYKQITNTPIGELINQTATYLGQEYPDKLAESGFYLMMTGVGMLLSAQEVDPLEPLALAEISLAVIGEKAYSQFPGFCDGNDTTH